MIILQTVLGQKVAVTWKLHMLCVHLEPLLTKLGRGLGIYAEQAGEAVHHKYKKTKGRFKRNKHHSLHMEALKKALCYWSRWNVYPMNKSTIQMYRDKARLKRKRLSAFK